MINREQHCLWIGAFRHYMDCARSNKYDDFEINNQINLIYTGAARYYMGRMSAGVSEFCEILIENWPTINEQTQKIIKRDLDREIKHHQECEGEYKPLGMECDYQEWLKVQRLWSKP